MHTMRLTPAVSVLFLLIAVNIHAAPPELLPAPDIVPPATEEMQHASFWVSRLDGDPDEVIMTAGQIDAFNAKNRTRPLTRTDIHGATLAVDKELANGNFAGITFHLTDPLDIGTIPGAYVTDRLRPALDHISSTELWDRRRLPYPDWKKRELTAAIDIEAVPAVISPRPGVIVRHTLNRFAPTRDRVYRGQYQWLDMFANAVLETGTPVAILHATRDGSWLYVRSPYSHGWAPADHVAEGSPADIRRFSDPDDFVVAIDHSVPVHAASGSRRVWLADIYMGARIPLAGKTPSGYRVILPRRAADGSLESAEAWIASDAPVSVGFQPYTRRTVIETAVRLLGRPDGWGGTAHERDCVGMVRAVFRTFGIDMPRWTTYELACTDHVTTFPADTPNAVKYRHLASCPPGITVCGFDWHVVLYLGAVDGVHYVIHQNGYSYHDENGVERRVGQVSLNHTELEGGADIGRWTDLAVFR